MSKEERTKEITRRLNNHLLGHLDTYSEPEETSIGWKILWAFIIIFGTCVLLETAHYLNWYIN